MSSWPDEHVERLKALHTSGLSMSQIAEALRSEFAGARYTRASVSGKVHRLNLPQRPVDARLAHLRVAAAQRAREMAANPVRKPMPKGVMVLPPLKGGSCTEMATANRAANVEARVNPASNVVRMDRAFSPLPGQVPVPFGAKGCRWPVGGEGVDMVQCGCAVDLGPYCDPHKATSRQQVQPKARTGNQLARSLRRYTA